MNKKNFFLLVSIIVVLPLLAMRKSPTAIARAKAQAEQAIGANNFAQAITNIGELRSIRENNIANQLEIQLLKKQLAQSKARVRAIPPAGVAPNVAAMQQQNVQLQQQNAKLLGANAALMTKLQAIKNPYEEFKRHLTALKAKFSAVSHESKQTQPGDIDTYQEFMNKVDEARFNKYFVKNLTGVRSSMDQVNISFDRVMQEAENINQQFFS